MQDIKSGFYVTELIGFGINGLTGDYSRGASGFLIENGAITHPVSEMTIVEFKRYVFNAHPRQRFSFRWYGVDAPTLRVDGMIVAGK